VRVIKSGRTEESDGIVRQDGSGRLGTTQEIPSLDFTKDRLDSRSAEYLDSAKAFADRFNGPTAKTFNTWWHKTVGTMYHLSTINAPFKRVFDAPTLAYAKTQRKLRRNQNELVGS